MRSTPRGTIIGFNEDFDENDPSFLEDEAAMIEWEKKTVKRYETWVQERTKLHVHIAICFFSQTVLIALLFIESTNDWNLRDTVLKNTS